MTSNFTLRDQIKDYWSMRAETFDLEPGHEIFSDREKAAWLRIIKAHLGAGRGRPALDLACGTSVITHLLDECGFECTGIDWSEEMLNVAREKSKKRRTQIKFRIGDAENTMEPHESYDVLVTRHLVWTLIDPARAFAHWYALLKPGGRVLIVDGDFVHKTWMDNISKFIDALQVRLSPNASNTVRTRLADMHHSILSQVYFSEGARSDAVSELLKQAGFQEIIVQTNMSDINRAQAKHLPLTRALARQTQHRYAISARKPPG